MNTELRGIKRLLWGIVLVLVSTTAPNLADFLPKNAPNEVDAEQGDEHADTPDTARSSNPRPIDEPAVVWEDFMSEHTEDMREINEEQKNLLLRIAVARVQEEGFAAFRSISESLFDAEVRIWVLDNLFKEIVRNEPQVAFDAAVDLRRDAGRSFFSEVALTWSFSDPIAVLNQTASADWDELELRQLRRAVVRDWANREPSAFLADSDQLPNDLKSYGQLQAIHSWATQEPDSAALHLSKIQNSTNKRTAAMAIARSWIEKDLDKAIEWVQTSPEIEEFRREILAGVLNRLAANEPTTAFEIALEQPVEDSHVGLEVSVIRKLVVNDLDLASKLLPKVREGTSKIAAISSVGTAFADSGNMGKALELAKDLPVGSRGMFLSNAVSMWGIANPKSVFEEIDKLPTASLKSRAAMMALTGNSVKEVLSKDQAEVLKTYLSEGSPEVFVPLQHEVAPSE